MVAQSAISRDLLAWRRPCPTLAHTPWGATLCRWPRSPCPARPRGLGSADDNRGGRPIDRALAWADGGHPQGGTPHGTLQIRRVGVLQLGQTALCLRNTLTGLIALPPLEALQSFEGAPGILQGACALVI